MTDRDTFAAAAMAGFIRGMPNDSMFHLGLIAKQAYEVADAILRERGAAPQPTLTDEERAATLASQGFWALEDSPHADTLRKLLERTK